MSHNSGMGPGPSIPLSGLYPLDNGKVKHITIIDCAAAPGQSPVRLEFSWHEPVACVPGGREVHLKIHCPNGQEIETDLSAFDLKALGQVLA